MRPAGWILKKHLATTAIGLAMCLASGLASGEALPGASALRAAVEDLVATFPQRYWRGREFLTRLEALQQRASQVTGSEAQAIHSQFEALRREALLSNPLVCAQPILFVVRPQYAPDHHNTETMFQTGEINTASFRGGGALKLLDISDPEHPRARTILEVPEGIVRDPEVHFDGRKVLFALRRNRQDDYHLFEMGLEGGKPVQLTFGSGISDIDPLYLPSGEIVFTSTRQPKFCMCNRHIMGNLFKMDPDGANIHQIGHSTLHEGHAALLPDGRILYDRWEYVDRNFGNAQGLWTVRPDGTQPAVWYGNSTDSPGAVLDGRPVPGTPWIVATLSSCHDRPWGALALLDHRCGVDHKPAVLRTWPADAIHLVDRGNYDTFIQVRPKYEDPYPLSAKYFLASRMTGEGERMGIYLLDVFGNEILVHVEGPGCYDPMPVGPRPMPPQIPPRSHLAETEGAFLVVDVYRGTGMERIARGTVRRLRVVESPEKRFWTHPAWDGGTGQQAPGMAWDDFNNKRILGTVPVEPDGSAYFAVPADRFVYFQLLDAEGRMVQSMRSGTLVRPGETAGCVGCHEDRHATAPLAGAAGAPLAARHPPRPLEPWHGPARLFDYLAEVQPVFDRHCVRCHDFGQPGGKVLNLASDELLIFNTSYVELRSKRFVQVVGAGPAQVLPPRSWGSFVSPLANVVLYGHKDRKHDQHVHLTAEDVDRILTWIDINAPYYPDYATAYRDHLYGRCPLNPQQLDRLGRLVGVDFTKRDALRLANFTRPELSPCLQRLPPQDPRRQEALVILRQGAELLRRQPAARLVAPAELAQQAKYDALRQREAAARQAIVRGQKLYERTEMAEK